MKRPAAAASSSSTKAKRGKGNTDAGAKDGTLNGQIETWKKGVADQDRGEDTHRDKGKGEKWAKMRSADEIEPHILHMYDNPPKGESSRKYRTALINRLFQRQSDGSLYLRSGDPMFQQAKQVYEERFQKNLEKMYTRLVFVAKNFNNNEAAFEKALSAGEILEEKGADGLQYYGFKQISRGLQKGSKDSFHFENKQKIDKRDAQALADLFTDLKWKYTPSLQDQKKMDEEGELPASAKKLLTQAVLAQEKLCKLSLALLKNPGDIPADLQKSMRKGHAAAQQHILNLQHISNFSEFPTGEAKLNSKNLDTYMLEVATNTKKLNEDIHQCQGLLKARKA